MNQQIRQRAYELGFEDCRFTTAAPPQSAQHFQAWLSAGNCGDMDYLKRTADKRLNPQLVLPGAKSAIVVAASYALSEECRVQGIGSRVPTPYFGPPPTRRATIARYARFTDYHKVLGERLEQLVEFVHLLGGEGTRSVWHVDAGPVLERDLAQRAGLGFIGKHTNLVSRKLGNWFFIAEVLTTLELEPDPPERNHCGSCSRCIAACPTGAITAPFQLDARRCISYLTIESKGSIPIQLRPLIGNRIFGCDDCLAACPWNRFAREAKTMTEHARRDLAALDLIELLSLDEDGFKRLFADTPVFRAKRRGLLRNVCVALGNVGDATALPDLERAAADAEPLISEHARWAIEQINKRILPNPAAPGTGPAGSQVAGKSFSGGLSLTSVAPQPPNSG